MNWDECWTHMYVLYVCGIYHSSVSKRNFSTSKNFAIDATYYIRHMNCDFWCQNMIAFIVICVCVLTIWGRVTHICVGNLTIIGIDKDLSPGRYQAIIGTNAGILLIEPLGTNLSEIVIEVLKFSLKKMHLKMSSEKWRQICLGFKVLNP